MDVSTQIVVVGGGAAGFFAAITAAEALPGAQVTILERGKEVLQKVKISGGGRCNVTHACFVPRELVKNYPRGEKPLMSPFSRFAPGDTIDWFEKRGVPLKIEDDGRMFPVSNSSQTIVDCLYRAATAAGVSVLKGHRLENMKKENDRFWIKTNMGDMWADKVLIASGSSTSMWALLKTLGHSIVAPVPSLFTFNIKDARIEGLAGVSMPQVTAKVSGTKLSATGPLLITHWGMSGPGILRLSAWGARLLADQNYRFSLHINWTGFYTTDEVREALNEMKVGEAHRKLVANTPQYEVPSRLWQRLVVAAGIADGLKWADLSKKHLIALAEQLTQATFAVSGKSTFKDEFVTAGGVALNEVNFKTFESKIVPNLFFAGEVLDIDAITGGFNFQAAWSGAWVAGRSMANLTTE